MRGVIAHGVLLAVMLGFAYHAWTKDRTVKVSTGEVTVWEMSRDLTAIELESTKADPANPAQNTQRTVRIEKRTDGGEYWWGTETRTDNKPKPANADSGSNAPPPTDTVATTTKREFPLGDSFRVAGATAPYKLTDMVHDFASMHAVRDLGTLTDDQKKDYDLAASSTTLAVISKEKTHTLILGGKVSGSSERYALDPDTNKADILAGALIDPIETGESALRPSAIHGFDPTALKAVTIAAAGKTKTAKKYAGTDAQGSNKEAWGDVATGKPDQTLDNFIDNLDKLVPSEYVPSIKPADLTPVIAVQYQDGSGKQIGALGLYKAERPGDIPEGGNVDPTNPPPPVTEYYVLTETTRVPAKVARPTAEKAEQDVTTVFGDQPTQPTTPTPPTSPKPATPAPPAPPTP